MKDRVRIKIDGRGLSTEDIVQELLDSRDIYDPERFLHPNTTHMLPFDELHNISSAADIVMSVVDRNGSILIWADTDTDGVCAASIVYRYLHHYTDNMCVTINSGKTHGIANADISEFDPFDLIIIVDSIEQDPNVYRRITEIGIQVVVLDHHIVPAEVDKPDIGIHLVSSANNYQNPHLSGAGVALKFCCYLDYLTLNDYADSLFDIAACGIIADMCDVSEMSAENRYICHCGFTKPVSPAIRALIGDHTFDAQSVSYTIAPLINAAMRTHHNAEALELFLIDDEEEIATRIEKLKEYKVSQAHVVDEYAGSLNELANNQLDRKCMFFIIDVLDAEVTGLIANRLLESYQRPIFVLKHKTEVDETTGEVISEEYRGSVRATGVENFKEYVEQTKIGWSAGHENAFGCGIPVDQFEDFTLLIEAMLDDVEFEQVKECDVWITPDQITPQLVMWITHLNRISGKGFDPIGVYIGPIEQYSVSSLSEGKHLKITSSDITLIQWNTQWEYSGSPRLSAYGMPNINTYRGRNITQLIVSDLFVGDVCDD